MKSIVSKILIPIFMISFSTRLESNDEFSALTDLPNSTEISIAIFRNGMTEKHGFIVNQGTLLTTENSHKLFEAGSITKVFTTLCAMNILNRRGIELDSPVAPHFSKNPPSSLNSITFRDLMTHRAGFPKMPTNFVWSVIKNPRNPFLNYKKEQFTHYLDKHESLENAEFAYSNFGMGLLGLVLSQIEGRPLESIFEREIFQHLQMHESSLGAQGIPSSGVLAGNGAGDTQKNTWQFSPDSAGAGALISNIDDFSKFLQAVLRTDRSESFVSESLKKMAVVQHEIDDAEAMALGWRVFRGQPNLFYHGGNTYNFKSLIAFDLEHQTAIVILTSAKSLSRKEIMILKKLVLASCEGM